MLRLENGINVSANGKGKVNKINVEIQIYTPKSTQPPIFHVPLYDLELLKNVVIQTIK